MGTSPVDAKTERLLNLVLALLATRRPLSKETLRRQVLQYEQIDDELFDRMFERDKEELRSLGIPLLVQQVDPLFDDELGYRIDRRAYALPPIEFTAAEVEAVRLASRTWARSSMAPKAASAIRKLAAAGVETDVPPGGADAGDQAGTPSSVGVSTDVAAFEPLKSAVLDRRAVTFDYRNARGDAGTRHVQPWRLQAWHGRWYVTGFDTDRGEPRIFRLGRISSPVKAQGKAGAYAIPDDHDAMAMVRRQMDPGAGGEATVYVARRAGVELRRRGRVVPDVVGPPGFDVLAIEFGSTEQMAGELARYGPDVVVVAPDALRTRVVGLLRGVVAQFEEARR